MVPFLYSLSEYRKIEISVIKKVVLLNGVYLELTEKPTSLDRTRIESHNGST